MKKWLHTAVCNSNMKGTHDLHFPDPTCLKTIPCYSNMSKNPWSNHSLPHSGFAIDQILNCLEAESMDQGQIFTVFLSTHSVSSIILKIFYCKMAVAEGDSQHLCQFWQRREIN